MNAFYLKIRKGGSSVPKLVLSPFESVNNSAPPEEESLYILDGSQLNVVEHTGYTLFNIGTLIYKNQWRRKALELIIDELSSGKSVEGVMPDTRGQFCLVIHSPSNLFIITDKLGSFPVYKFEDNDTIQISNILLLLAKKNAVSINHQAFAEYLSFDYCLNCTLFNEIEHLKMGTIYQFGGERRAYTYDEVFSDIHFNKYDALGEVAHEVREMLVKNLSFLSSSDRILVDLTGGFDTRTVATILHAMNVDFEAGICGEQVPQETVFAKSVAQALGKNLHANIKIRDRELLRRILNRQFDISAGVPILYHSVRLINYYENLGQDFDIHLTGFGGTELITSGLPRMSLFSSKIGMKSLFAKRFGYKNIFNNRFMTESRYFDQIVQKIHTLLRLIGSDQHSEVANFLLYATANKYFHGVLIGTHNVIMPLYSPFLESNFVRLMLETAYGLKDDHAIQRALISQVNPRASSIMTDHGYCADIGSKRVNSLSWRCQKWAKNVGRRTIYQFRLLINLMAWMKNFWRKCKASTETQRLTKLQHAFWVSEVDEAWSDELEIFAILDRNKLKAHLTCQSYPSKLKAKILFVNRVITECKPKLE